MKRVAIQGYKGCFHEQAARLFYSETPLSIVECDTFPDLYTAMDEFRADAAVMAIENTVSGEPNVQTIGKVKIGRQTALDGFDKAFRLPFYSAAQGNVMLHAFLLAESAGADRHKEY